MTKLHLGCGTRYLDGYVNIDYPASEHTVQRSLVADRCVDITELTYPVSTVDEIRLHHVFEHFPRQIALALLCQWTDWLKPGGLLRIETPDVMASAWALISPLTSSGTRHQIVRHLFGSHEAGWAAHWDGWYKDRFRLTLTALGFHDLRFTKSRWGATRNIEIWAIREDKKFTLQDYRKIVKDLLAKSLVTHRSRWSFNAVAESERAMLEVWMCEWERAYTSVPASADQPGRA